MGTVRTSVRGGFLCRSDAYPGVQVHVLGLRVNGASRLHSYSYSFLFLCELTNVSPNNKGLRAKRSYIPRARPCRATSWLARRRHLATPEPRSRAASQRRKAAPSLGIIDS